MSCARCHADVQPADFGSPRRCAFDDAGRFVVDNWNCATLDALLALAEQTNRLTDLSGFDESAQAMYVGSDDWDEDGDPSSGWFVLTRYKHRGRTDGLEWVGRWHPARPITLALCEQVIARFTAATAKN